MGGFTSSLAPILLGVVTRMQHLPLSVHDNGWRLLNGMTLTDNRVCLLLHGCGCKRGCNAKRCCKLDESVDQVVCVATVRMFLVPQAPLYFYCC